MVAIGDVATMATEVICTGEEGNTVEGTGVKDPVELEEESTLVAVELWQ